MEELEQHDNVRSTVTEPMILEATDAPDVVENDFYKILLQSNFHEVHTAIFGEAPSELAKEQINKYLYDPAYFPEEFIIVDDTFESSSRSLITLRH